jgi:hypothetical protein
LVLLTVIHQSALFLGELTYTHMTFQIILRRLRWRLKQIGSMIAVWIIVRGREKMEEICLQRHLLETEALKVCSNHQDRRTLLDGIRKFGLIFNWISLGLLLAMHMELEAEHSVLYQDTPYYLWQFSIPINFWLAECYFLLTTDILTFLLYFIIIWWCTLVQAGVQYTMKFRQQLKLTKSLQTDIEKLQHIIFTLQSFYTIMEESFSGILFWHICASILTGLCFLGDIIKGSGSDHWLSLFVGFQMLIWNTVFLVGVPNLFSIRFQEEVGFFALRNSSLAT